MNFPPQLKTQRVIILNGLLSYDNKQILHHIILIGKIMKIRAILFKALTIVNLFRSS